MSSSTLPKPMPAQFRRKLLLWIPTLIWLGVLASFSTDLFSAEHTGSILWKIVHAIYPGISLHAFHTLHFLVRKTAHFTAYGLLCVFAFFSWRVTFPSERRWRWNWSALALALTFVAASLDEFHQTFVPSRTGNFHDVLLDMTGAVFFQILIWAFSAEKTCH